VLRDLTFGETPQRAPASARRACPRGIEHDSEPGTLRLTVYADSLLAADSAAIARHLIARPEEISLSRRSKHGGSRGVMQLIIVLAPFERRITGKGR